jgi:hypothetical protein
MFANMISDPQGTKTQDQKEKGDRRDLSKSRKVGII